METEQRWQGLLWEISGNGLTEPSYLYGTMHVSSKLAFNLADSVYIGIKNCDIVALETDPSTWMDDFLSEEADYSYYSYYNYYNTGFYVNAFPVDFPLMDELAYELRREHSMTNHMLYRASYYDNSDFEEQTYLDLFIFQAGKKWKKEIAALENYETTMDLLDKAYEPDENEDDEEYYDFWDFYGYSKSPYEMIEDAYRSGDLDLLDTLSRLTNPSRNYHKYFIEERNKIMANNMDSIMQAGHTLFTAVGAAHLPGDTGVIELLHYMGYKVRPVVKTQTKYGRKTKEKLEDLFVEQPHTHQLVSDKAFSVNMPGKLYQTMNEPSYKEYFFPDMANGSYYHVSRINHFGMYRDESPEYILQRIDSLLYENIPGKILSQKSIVRNGVPGIEVRNETRKGEYQRYHIYATPLEIFIFKMSGIDEYVKDYGDPFFSSISFNNVNSSGWQTFERESGVFKIDLPTSAVIKSFDSNAASSSTKEFAQGIDHETGNYYFFSISGLYDYYYIEDDTFELSRLAYRYAEQIDYIIESTEFNLQDDHPAMNATLSNGDKNVYLRYVLVGPLYYLMGAQSLGDRPNEFFNSFQLLNRNYTQPFETYIDSSYFFSVQTLPEEWEEPASSSYYYYYDDYEEVDYDSDYGNKVFRSDSTYEEIQVYYYKYHDYYSYEDDQPFWSTFIDEKDYEEGSSMLVHYDMDTLAVVPWLYLVIGDSGSADRIHLKYILQEGAFYTISYATDSITGLTDYAETFFSTFAPLPDTLIGCNVFSSKAEMFFDYAASGDSTSVMEALNSISLVVFEEEHIDRLIELLDTLDYDRYGMHFRPAIIEELGYIESDKLLPVFEQMYLAVEDTATLQMEVLRAFGHQNTEDSYDMFLKMIMFDTPLSSDSWDIAGVFYSVSDSLELAARLYPEILDFTYFDEYRNEVLSLLNILLDSGAIEPEMYKDHVPTLALEAGYELKRLRASEEDEFNSYNYDYYNYSYGYDYNDPYRERSDLEHYINLLAPFYDEPVVEKLFSKLPFVEDANLKLTTAKLMVKYDIPGSDTIWANYVANDDYRISVIELLDTLGRLDLIDSSEYTQQIISQAFSQSGYSYNSEEADSIIFVRKEYVKNADDEGYVYFFKYESGPKWELAYSGIQPLDTTRFNLEEIVSDKGISFMTDEEMENEITNVLDHFYVIGRSRAISGTIEDNYYGGYYGWY